MPKKHTDEERRPLCSRIRPDAFKFVSNYLIPNPEEFARNLLKAYEDGSEALVRLIERPNATTRALFARKRDVGGHPDARRTRPPLADGPAPSSPQAQGEFFRLFGELWNNVLQRMIGLQVPPLIEPEPGDNRFKDPEWTANPYFDFWKQAYLLTCRWAEELLAETDGSRRARRAPGRVLPAADDERAIRPRTSRRPTPKCCARRSRTNGANLVEGMKLLANDMETLRRPAARSARRTRRPSKSARTSRPRPARSSSRTTCCSSSSTRRPPTRCARARC